MTKPNLNINAIRKRDRLLTDLLYAVTTDENVRQNLILQGGGAMHFIYGSPRFSNDLDFVCPSFRSNPNALTERLEAISKKFLEDRKKDPEFANYVYVVLKKGNERLRISYNSDTPQMPSIRIELVAKPSFDYAPSAGKFHPLLVESPAEIYVDKIYASLGRMHARGSIKTTDLFDLDYLTNNLDAELDEELLIRKALSYNNIGFSQSNVDDLLEYIKDVSNHSRFVEDLQRTLLPDVFSNKQFNREYFEKVATHFENIPSLSQKQMMLVPESYQG